MVGLGWDKGQKQAESMDHIFSPSELRFTRNMRKDVIESGNAYRCFCSPERLSELRTEQEKTKQTVGYDRKCQDIPVQETRKLFAENRPHVIRLKIPLGRKVIFEGLIRGPIEYSSDVLDDIVLIKSDGFPTYHMANVVDDHLMNITHVMRGDEWISSTPRHVLLYEAFGWKPPCFAHLPVILAEDGKKLSKRKGAASVMDYQRIGYLNESLFNFLALLGWAPGNDREKMPREEIVKAFSIDHISPKPAIFDEKKLDWMNGLYMAERPAASLVPEVVPVWKERGWIGKDSNVNDQYCSAVIDILKVRSKKLIELIDNAEYFFKDPVVYEDKAVKKQFNPETVSSLKSLVNGIENMTAFNAMSLEKMYHEYSEKSHLEHRAAYSSNASGNKRCEFRARII